MGKLILDPSCVWDKDIDKVAATALLRLPPEKREQGGVLYKNGAGEYCYSTFGPGDETKFKLTAQIPDDATLAGLYHSHPGSGGEVGKFQKKASPAKHSSLDAEVAGRLRVPSYIRVDQSGEIRRLDPGQRHNMVVRANVGD
jgi:hypothetical protein